MKLPSHETNPNHHPLCKPQHCVQIFGKRGSVVLKISDTCPECKRYDVDVADEIFPKLDDKIKGRVKMSWQMVNCKFYTLGVQSQKTFFESWIIKLKGQGEFYDTEVSVNF